MRGSGGAGVSRSLLVGWALVSVLGGVLGCADAGVPVPGHPDANKTPAVERAARRLFDGAPPTIPHAALGAACVSCHDAEGMAVEDLGFAPPSPHEATPGMSALSRCQQCHVFAGATEPLVANAFVGLEQDLRRGPRLNPLSPPVLPHPVLMRENCAACHDGPAAREEIRTSHPERVRCQQCHVPRTTDDTFPPR